MHGREIRKRAIALYASGLSARATARRLREDHRVVVTPQTIARWTRRLGLSRPVGDRRRIEVGKEAQRQYESGLSLEQVARRLGVGKTAVGERLREMGVAIRPTGSRFVHLLTKDRLENLYITKDYSAGRIASEFGCSAGTVSRLVRVHKLQKRGHPV